MPYQLTTATKKVIEAHRTGKRVLAFPGGTSASKTVSIVLFFIHLAQSDKIPTISAIVSETMPHLKRGAMRDFLQIMEAHGYYKDENWNKSDFIYTFETGSKIEFYSVEQDEKVRGLRRDRLFINEANNIPYMAFDQLEVRTKEFVVLDWNPTNEFWYYTEVKGKRNDVLETILTYRDNEALDPRIKASIEQRKNNKSWWTVFGEGMLGEVDWKIYRDWQIVDEIPHEARLERYGLDFGYTNDPTAIVAIYKWNGGFILDEVCFQKGLLNKPIADLIKNLPPALVIADSAEPKSIDEIKGYGVNIIPAIKGQGSVNQGIAFVQNQRISVTKRSTNIIKEYRNYLWIVDKDGKVINEPAGGYDHTMDAIRYGLSSYEEPLQENIFQDLQLYAGQSFS